MVRETARSLSSRRFTITSPAVCAAFEGASVTAESHGRKSAAEPPVIACTDASADGDAAGAGAEEAGAADSGAAEAAIAESSAAGAGAAEAAMVVSPGPGAAGSSSLPT